MRTRALLAPIALAALAALAQPRAARADTPPGAWDVAKDPAARDRWELHVHVRRLIAQRSARLMGMMRDLPLDQARALLEGADAKNSPDVRLRFDLGETYELLQRHQAAIEVLEAATNEQPNAPGVEDALAELAYAYAHMDMPHQEIATYKRYIRVVIDDSSRSTAVLNLAEAQMRVGNLADAVTGYREAQHIAEQLPNTSGGITTILAVWGLAVALDRSGDPVGAAESAKLAVSLDPGERLIGDDRPGSLVFFEPSRERYWYTALGAQEEAKNAADARAAVMWWTRAVDRWTRYIDDAERDTRPRDLPTWLPLARAHREAAKKALAAADKRLKSEPRRPPALIDLDEP